VSGRDRPDGDWRAAGERIEALIAAGASPGAAGRDRAEELVRLVADLYGAGLERLLDLLHEHGALRDDVLDALAGDDLVASLLLVHGLHPYDVRTRVEQAVAGVSGEVELLGITSEGVARLRMPASHGGCSATPAPSRQEIEEALEAAAPEITAIELEAPTAAGAVIPVSALFARLADAPGSDAAEHDAPGLDAPGIDASGLDAPGAGRRTASAAT